MFSGLYVLDNYRGHMIVPSFLFSLLRGQVYRLSVIPSWELGTDVFSFGHPVGTDVSLSGHPVLTTQIRCGVVWHPVGTDVSSSGHPVLRTWRCVVVRVPESMRDGIRYFLSPYTRSSVWMTSVWRTQLQTRQKCRITGTLKPFPKNSQIELKVWTFIS